MARSPMCECRDRLAIHLRGVCMRMGCRCRKFKEADDGEPVPADPPTDPRPAAVRGDSAAIDADALQAAQGLTEACQRVNQRLDTLAELQALFAPLMRRDGWRI